jgi:Tetratricopeptide repeat
MKYQVQKSIMKKIITVFCFVAGVQTAFAQTKTADSLQAVLTKTTKSIDRFNLINKILENENGFSGNVDSAACIELLQIAQQLNNDSLLAISYDWIGTYFSLSIGDNTTALEYYFKAIPLAEKVQDKRRISSIYFDIALIYFNLQNNEEAVKYIRKGGENLPDNSHPLYDYMLAQYQRGMATYFVLTNQPDSALHYGQAMVETSRRAKSLLFQYNGMHLSGAANSKSGEKEMAEIYFKKAIAISDSIKSSSAKLRFSINYIPFLLKNNRLNEAREQATQLLNFGNQINNNNLKLAGAGFMRQVFDTLRNADSAYYYSRMELQINAQIFNQNNNNKIQALAFNEQIRLMEDAAKKTAEAQQRKENIQYSLIALGIIVLLTLYLLLSRSFITNTKLIEFFGIIALLIVFEFLNLLLHPFLERITNHSPVLMLLALVCIAALLVPLHHQIEKWATAKLVEKNKKIRLAAAKKTIEQLEGNNN